MKFKGQMLLYLNGNEFFLEKDYDIDYLRVRRMRLKQKFKNKKK